MKVIYGLKSGAVLQRDANGLCRCIFKADAVGTVRSSLGSVSVQDGDRFVLSGIPTGGPYDLVLSDDECKITFSDIYVGDVWLLAGQSNMEGAGKWRARYMAYDQDPIPSIRAYYMNESWGAAKTQLHQLWESVDEYISKPYREYRLGRWGSEYPEVQNNGVGPGLYFALEMQKRLGGVPQGVIPCGIGGSGLEQWLPDEENNLYAAAMRRVRECGGLVRGVFWHQGESQANPKRGPHFVSDMQKLVAGIRRDLGDPQLPFVQVQINKYVSVAPSYDIWWTRIREAQRTLEQHIDHLATVYSVDCELDDLIHLSSESQEKIGARAAEAMARLIGEEANPSPEVESFEIIVDDYVPFFVNLRVNYKNLVGDLTSLGVPSGYAFLEAEDGEPLRAIARVCLEGKSVRLKAELDAKRLESCYLCYGYGNGFYCNVTDAAGRSLPGFGPLKIKDYLKKEND